MHRVLDEGQTSIERNASHLIDLHCRLTSSNRPCARTLREPLVNRYVRSGPGKKGEHVNGPRKYAVATCKTSFCARAEEVALIRVLASTTHHGKRIDKK